MTKKEIFAKYGIAYDGNNHIETPIGTMCLLLKVGNTKVGKNVKTWSMNQTTCLFHCKDCYANSGHYQRSNVKRSLARNTELARNHIEFLERALMAQCETFKDGTEIRIHCVGDFNVVPDDDKYVEMWERIIKAFPNLIFWTYTKMQKYEDRFNKYPNANIVKSLIDGEFNFGHCDHVMALFEKLIAQGKNVHICRCGVDDEQHCEGCHKCSLCEFVLFLEHSTKYNAKKDPLYNAFVEMVNNQ